MNPWKAAESRQTTVLMLALFRANKRRYFDHTFRRFIHHGNRRIPRGSSLEPGNARNSELHIPKRATVPDEQAEASVLRRFQIRTSRLTAQAITACPTSKVAWLV